MTDIQQARDVLAKWRDIERNGKSWQVEAHGGFATVRDDQKGEVARAVLSDDAHLIVGTAGNPELLDAIDTMLKSADKTPPTTEWGDHGLRIAGQRIAAAIIAADGRMNK